ncbi:hypothetical protein L596_002448 [Steinernema carpocapsae]|uniref:Uncharacterized protein n=1 Tax=Steinernema carpocapsae TaxID=34508 RepID=A0A4U8UR42_STECR|nr:hypothetical protein L596_002448 [Steinernema carpocapsae]
MKLLRFVVFEDRATDWQDEYLPFNCRICRATLFLTSAHIHFRSPLPSASSSLVVSACPHAYSSIKLNFILKGNVFMSSPRSFLCGFVAKISICSNGVLRL